MYLIKTLMFPSLRQRSGPGEGKRSADVPRTTRRCQLAALVVSLVASMGSPSLFSADIIPADRRTNWTPGVYVGVPGGIPTNRTRRIDVTAPPYNADKTGATDARPAIQAALEASAQ